MEDLNAMLKILAVEKAPLEGHQEHLDVQTEQRTKELQEAILTVILMSRKPTEGGSDASHEMPSSGHCSKQFCAKGMMGLAQLHPPT